MEFTGWCILTRSDSPSATFPCLSPLHGDGIGVATDGHLGNLVAQMVKNLPAMQENRVQSSGREDPLEKGITVHSSLLAWRNPMDRGAWRATVHGVAKSRTQLKQRSMQARTFA